MKTCKQCGAEMNDNAMFCTKCGTRVEEQNAAQSEPYSNAQEGGAYNGYNAGYNAGYQQYQVPVDIYDHTAEFDPKDISDNKVFAMLVYLMGTFGIIIALLASSKSEYVTFHVRQGVKFEVVGILTLIVSLLLIWTFIVPTIAGIFGFALFICKIIAFFSICKGRASEPYIIRKIGFLK